MSKKKRKIYFIGIKGVGMTMLAQFLAERGEEISGSDIKDVFLTDKVLRAAKIPVLSPFKAANVPLDADLIICSSAFTPENNPELALIKNQAERFKKTKILSYAAALGSVFNEYQGIAVCGSHGKTTTSAWLGYVLWRAGKHPNVLVGSRVPQFKGSSLFGRGREFVAEVDEYQNKLQYFWPHGVVLNNIEFDHPDFFKDQAAYTKVFADFLKKIPARGWLVISAHDPEIKKIKKYCRGRVISYGVSSPLLSKIHGSLNYGASDLETKGLRQSFRVWQGSRDLGIFTIQLSGLHNILNALAVIASARELKVPLAKIRKSLDSFKGSERRAQVLGDYRGALIIDDYAHHPTEIRATLQGLRAQYPRKKIWVVFHPHTFTRTAALFPDFASSFQSADELIILDIYSSAREVVADYKKITSARLAQAIKQHNRCCQIKQGVRNIKTIPQVAAYLRARIGERDLVVLMGAGDVFRVGQRLLK